MTWLTLGLAVAGFGTALLSGVAGIGGGTVLIAVLFALGLAPAVAVPLHAAVQLVANGTRALAYRQHVQWGAAGWFLITAVPAPFLVASWVSRVDTAWVQVGLAGLILLSLIPQRGPQTALMGLRPAYLLAGAVTGGLGMFVGATGMLLGRLFLRPEWSSQTMVGTLALCQTLGHLLKIVAFATVGASILQRPDLLSPLLVAAVLGTFVGRWLHERVPQQHFRVGFRLLLAALALKLGVDGVGDLQ